MNAKRLSVLFLLLCLLPAFALAAKPTLLYVNGVNVIDDGRVACGSGFAAYDSKTNTLTLDHAAIDAAADPEGPSAGYGVYADGDLNVLLDGRNAIANAAGGMYSQGALSLSGKTDGASLDIRLSASSSSDAALRADQRINISNITLTGDFYAQGIWSEHVYVTDSVLDITSKLTPGILIAALYGDLNILRSTLNLTAMGGWGIALGGLDIDIRDSVVEMYSNGPDAISSYGSLTIGGDSDVLVKRGKVTSPLITLDPTAHAFDVLAGENADSASHYAASPYSAKTVLPAEDDGRALSGYRFVHFRKHLPTPPQTGDASHMALWLSLTLASCAALLCLRRRAHA